MDDPTQFVPVTPSIYGIVRYIEPDLSITADQLSLYGFAQPKRVVDKSVLLHDPRTAATITHGPLGLDDQGFTYIKHGSRLSDDQLPDGGRWFEGACIEEEYLPEVQELAKDVLGARKVAVLNCVLRRASPEMHKDPYRTDLRGGEFDRLVANMPKDTIVVSGRDPERSKWIEPFGTAHIDFSLQGLKDTARYCRKDVLELTKDAIAAEDQLFNAGSTCTRVPRYAAYSVWRPLQPVKRDCLAVMDSRTLLQSEIQPIQIRHHSDINASGEYLSEAKAVLPPTDASAHEWYAIPNQQPDEVLFIKLADTASENNLGVSPGCGHCSPQISGTEHERMRSSVEVRILAVWDSW